MANNPDRIYWDSVSYLNYLKGNHPRHNELQMIIDDWKSGAVTIVTSALTITEVLYVKIQDSEARMQIDRSREEDLRQLFEPPPHQFLTIVELNRWIAMGARELVWSYGVLPKDAIHVASALQAHVPVLHTFDGGLIKRSGTLGGNPTLRIEEPQWTRQLNLEGEQPS